MKKFVLALGAVLAIASPSHAALIVALDINGAPAACAVDNNAPCAYGVQIQDIDPAVGILSYGNTPINIGGLIITGSSQQAILGPPQNILNTSSTQLQNTTAANLTATLAVSATGFTPPVSQAFTSGSATWQNAAGSSIAMSWYDDPNNQQGAETATDLPGLLVSSCTDAITLVADSTACSAGPIAVSDLAPFSMTLFSNMVLTPGATVVNRGQTEIKPVPEPASMALFGLGIVVFGSMARRIRR